MIPWKRDGLLDIEAKPPRFGIGRCKERTNTARCQFADRAVWSITSNISNCNVLVGSSGHCPRIMTRPGTGFSIGVVQAVDVS
jgi:hypothetical protein